ncbi:EF-hand domain-containing protein [Caulifigura coniformis]|uniref:EF-hand domain-containing protein n=1 Tax=Caulifigura coniformis TaxID=2527983 RepID=UPI0018D26965|nr:EF-hand domain-containing protein [Caulifigura coniformis]
MRIRSRIGARCAIVAALLAVACSGCGDRRKLVAQGLFKAADSDNSGAISIAEFHLASPESAPEDREKAFTEADVDNNQQLTFEEYRSSLPGPEALLWTLGIFSAVSFIGSLVAIPIVVARLPIDHFSGPHEAADWVASSVGRRIWLVLKNILGVLLITGGVIMLVLPGQGVLTILLGVALMDLPGKWRLMRALARRPNVMKALNWMRERAGKPPLIPPPAKGTTRHEMPLPVTDQPPSAEP